MIRFNSQKLKYRAPFGAVTAGTEIRFFVEFLQDGVKVTLRLWVDGAELLIAGENRDGGAEFRFTPSHAGLVWYYFIVNSPEGRLYYSGSGGEGALYKSEPASYQLTVYDGFKAADWFANGIVYQIFPDRFFRPDKTLGTAEHGALGHRLLLHENWGEPVLYTSLQGEPFYTPCDFYGGNLWGVIEKLPYIASLGASCIYLNPVFLSCSNHRYNVTDYMAVDPMLGGDEALAALTKAARGYGMRIMLDGVFSHTGDDSVYFDRYGKFGGGACSDPASPYREWYSFEEYPAKYRCWWGFTSLPEVNELTPSYMSYIGRVLEHYASLGVTSWRLDVADELPDEFIAFLKAKLKELDAECVLLGEVWEDASNKEGFGARRKYVDGHELDSVMNYPFRSAAMDFFLGACDAKALKSRLLGLIENYPAPFYAAQLNILGSHDTVRALSALGGAPPRDALPRCEQAAFSLSQEQTLVAQERLKSAAALQFSMPGVPSVYYGDEAGMTGMADPFNRGTYPWGQENETLLRFYQTLAAVRNGSNELKAGGCAMAAPSEDVFAVCRGGAICAVNRANEARALSLTSAMFEGPYEAPPFDGNYTDALSLAKTLAQGGAINILLPPLGRIILKKDIR